MTLKGRGSIVSLICGLLILAILLVPVRIKAEESLISVPQIPNLRIGSYLDLKELESYLGFESRLFYCKGFDLGVGYVINSKSYGVIGIGFDLKELKRLNLNVDYAWEKLIDLRIGLWLGYNITDRNWKYGVSAQLVEIK